MLLKDQNDNAIRRIPSKLILICLFGFFLPHQFDSLSYNCGTVTSDNGISQNTTFAIGENISFCVHFLPFNIKTTFSMKVDSVQALTLRRNFEVVKNSNTDLSFQVSGSKVLSQQVVS